MNKIHVRQNPNNEILGHVGWPDWQHRSSHRSIAARRLARRLGLPLPTAATVAELAGLGVR